MVSLLSLAIHLLSLAAPVQPDSKSPIDVNRLIIQLQSRNADERLRAAENLGRLGAQAAPAIPFLIKALDDNESVSMRSTVAATLGFIGPKAKEAVPVLIRMLEKRVGVREAAAALGNIEPDCKQAVPLLLSILKEANDKDIIVALAKFGAHARIAVPYLCESLSSPDPEVRYAASLSLAGLGCNASAAIPTLVKRLRGKPDRVFSEMYNGGDLNVFVGLALAKVDPENTEVVRAFQTFVQDKNVPTRIMAISFLGEIKIKKATNEVVRMLERALQDENEQVRAAAGTVLKKVKDQE